MALDKADSISQINNLFPDNTTGEISPADQRVVNINAISSNLNLVDPGLQVATGSASLSTKQIGVNSIDHLPTPSGGVITLDANTVYHVGNDINLGTNRIVMSDDTVIVGISESNISMTYTGTGTMFTCTNVSARINNVSITCASGTFLDVSGTGVEGIILNGVNVNGVAILGTITNIRSFGWDDGAIAVISTRGFLFVTTITKLNLDNLVFVATTGVVIDFGTAIFDTVDIDGALFSLLTSGATAISGAVSSANISAGGLGEIKFCHFSGSGTPLSGLTTDDALWNFLNNDDIANSRPDGLLSFIDNTTETVITTIGVEVLVAGTWNIVRTSQFTGTAAGRLTYNGGRPVTVPVTVSTAITVASGTNQELHLHLFLNGVIIEQSKVQSNVDSGDTKNQVNIWELVMSSDDYIELFVENNSTTNNITVIDAKFRIN